VRPGVVRLLCERPAARPAQTTPTHAAAVRAGVCRLQAQDIFNRMLDRSAELKEQMQPSAAISLQASLSGLWQRAQKALSPQEEPAPRRHQLRTQRQTLAASCSAAQARELLIHWCVCSGGRGPLAKQAACRQQPRPCWGVCPDGGCSARWCLTRTSIVPALTGTWPTLSSPTLCGCAASP
jgi:hypothetical protein